MSVELLSYHFERKHLVWPLDSDLDVKRFSVLAFPHLELATKEHVLKLGVCGRCDVE